ncbi:MAG TPA: hypothetical protein VL120_11720 [Solirubrobacteraceae bacterium]|jgi:hypothetical protein|nr:hypothetical protein [Solirubrobacteraceae bacterium]
MHPLGKRVWLWLGLGLLAVPVTMAGVAYACTALATITTSSPSAVAGSVVTVAGKGFAPFDPADISTAPALVHMDSITGPVLAQAAPTSNNAGGTFSVDVTVPNVPAGDHVIVVTQNDVTGAPAYGTPARTVLSVVPAPLAPIIVPVITAPIALGTVPVAPVQTAAQKLAKAIAKCKTTNNVSKAKTAAGRKRVASRRASCIARAKRAAKA